jgi:hypothetical protein
MRRGIAAVSFFFSSIRICATVMGVLLAVAGENTIFLRDTSAGGEEDSGPLREELLQPALFALVKEA